MKKNNLISLILILSLAINISCNTEKKGDIVDMITDVATPLWLDYGQTEIFLSDYVKDCSLIDSVVINNIKKELTENKQKVVFITPDNCDPVIGMKVWSKGAAYTIVLKRSNKQEIEYRFNPDGKVYSTVQLSGEFNGWTPSRTNLELIDGVWNAGLILNRGKYQYQLVVDGKYMLDPACSISVDNNLGGYNSLMEVGDKKETDPPFIFAHSFSKSEVLIKTLNKPDDVFVMLDNYQLDKSFYNFSEDILTIKMPSFIKNKKRSFLRVWAYNGSGLSNDLLVPFDYGEVINEADKLVRTDFHKNILYNVFVDRFYNGNSSNDRLVADSTILPRANYHGGDIAGIEKKIEDGYFEEIGVNTIWLSPIVKNPEGAFGEWKDPPSKFSGYHGYWPISFTKVDDRFGTSEEVKSLVSVSHSKEINVLLDFVANHVHQEHPVYIAHPDWATKLYLPDGSLNTERWDEYRLTTWFDVFLPTLNLENPEIVEMLSDSALWWLKEYEFDGFRHDATKHVPEIFWRTLTRKIKNEIVEKEDKPIFQVGETYGGVELIGSYIGSGMLDAQFDFNVYDAALGVFAGKGNPFGRLHDRLSESMEYYGAHNLMCYITGNQDRGRYISYAGGDLKFDENAKVAGWTRYIGVGDTIGYRKLEMLMAFNMTIPGLPVIFYGDEFGMPGGNDPDCRRMMRFNSELNRYEKQTLETTKQLAKIRQNNLALIYGDLFLINITDDIYIYARKYFDNTVVVIFNKSDREEDIKIDNPIITNISEYKTSFGSKLDIDSNEITVTLPALSFEILINNRN